MESIDNLWWNSLSEEDKAFLKPIRDQGERARKDREFLFTLWRKAMVAKQLDTKHHYNFVRDVILDIEDHLEKNP